MSTFWTGGVKSTGSTLGFFGGGFWGFGRLLAPPTASQGSQRHTASSSTTASTHRCTPAIPTPTTPHSRRSLCCPYSPTLFFLNSPFDFIFDYFLALCSLLTAWFCCLLFLFCLTRSPFQSQRVCWHRNRGWSIQLNINVVYWYTVYETNLKRFVVHFSEPQGAVITSI